MRMILMMVWYDTGGTIMIIIIHTVDGRIPAPVDRQFIPLFARIYTSQVVIAGFLNHQQYLQSKSFSLQLLLLPDEVKISFFEGGKKW